MRWPAFILAGGSGINASASDPAKLVMMHYMPWFDTPASNNGQWGMHWTMGNQNPDNIDATGRHDIAAHYYPLIGPYASNDDRVLDYHMELMKMAGIDGIILDYYGVKGSNGDVELLQRNSDQVIQAVIRNNMKFIIMLEDRFSTDSNDVLENVQHIRDNYMALPSYAIDENTNQPWLMVFGPNSVLTDADWDSVLGSEAMRIITHSWNPKATTVTDGRYSWPWADKNDPNDDHAARMEHFYRNYLNDQPEQSKVGAVYPGFHDFYAEGGWGDSYFYIDHKNGDTIDQMVQMAMQYEHKVNMHQLVTWNDFGEGTMMEPTREFGFDSLIALSPLTGGSTNSADYQSILDGYLNIPTNYMDVAIQDASSQICPSNKADGGCYTQSPPVWTQDVSVACAMTNAECLSVECQANGIKATFRHDLFHTNSQNSASFIQQLHSGTRTLLHNGRPLLYNVECGFTTTATTVEIDWSFEKCYFDTPVLVGEDIVYSIELSSPGNAPNIPTIEFYVDARVTAECKYDRSVVIDAPKFWVNQEDVQHKVSEEGMLDDVFKCMLYADEQRTNQIKNHNIVNMGQTIYGAVESTVLMPGVSYKLTDVIVTDDNVPPTDKLYNVIADGVTDTMVNAQSAGSAATGADIFFSYLSFGFENLAHQNKLAIQCKIELVLA